MLEFLFLDLDDTILDFKKAEDAAIRETLRHCGIADSDENVALYSAINKRHWKMLEKQEITREQLKIGRFARLFEALDIRADAQDAAAFYPQQLGKGYFFLPGAEAAVKTLAKKYRLFLASNGIAAVQHRRLTGAGLYPYFEQVFISENLGADKPSKLFFERSFAQIPGFDPEKAMIVGDSLSSDILGGKNAGIATCWVNPGHKEAPEEKRPDFEIECLSQLEAILN